MQRLMSHTVLPGKKTMSDIRPESSLLSRETESGQDSPRLGSVRDNKGVKLAGLPGQQREKSGVATMRAGADKIKRHQRIRGERKIPVTPVIKLTEKFCLQAKVWQVRATKVCFKSGRQPPRKTNPPHQDTMPGINARQ